MGHHRDRPHLRPRRCRPSSSGRRTRHRRRPSALSRGAARRRAAWPGRPRDAHPVPAGHRRGGCRRVPDGLLRRHRPRRRRRRDGRHHRRGAGLHRGPVHGDGPAGPARGPLAGGDGGRRGRLRHARHRRACIRGQRGGRRIGAARQLLLRGVRRHRLVPDHQRGRGPRRRRRHLRRRGRPAPAGPVHQPHELGGDRPGPGGRHLPRRAHHRAGLPPVRPGTAHHRGDHRDHARPGRTGHRHGPRASRAQRAPDHDRGRWPGGPRHQPGHRGLARPRALRPPSDPLASRIGPRKAPPHRASHRRRPADEDRSGGRAAVIAAFAARGSGLTCPQSSTCRRGSPSGRRRGRGRPGAG